MALVRYTLIALLVASVAGCEGCSCSGAEPAVTVEPDVAEDDVAEDAVMPDVAEAAEVGVDVLGLRLGAPGGEAADVWLTGFGIPCSAGTDEERSLLVTECRDINGVVFFELRSFGGETARVILEQTMDSTVVSVSIRRRHPAVTAGYSDYGPTCELLAEELGPGTVSGGFDGDPRSTEPSMETTSWSNERFALDVEILRGMGPSVMVTETWRWHQEPQD